MEFQAENGKHFGLRKACPCVFKVARKWREAGPGLGLGHLLCTAPLCTGSSPRAQRKRSVDAKRDAMGDSAGH